MYICRVILIGSVCLLSSLFTSAQAAIYKCKDTSGGITYSQTACIVDQQSMDKVMRISGSNASGVECGIVRNFAAEVGLYMSTVKSVGGLQQKFGGAKKLSPVALKIINSVFKYQSLPYKTVENTVYNESQNCKDELYGKPKCADFPTSFIKMYGSCIDAGDANQRIKRIAEFRPGKSVEETNQDSQLALERKMQQESEEKSRQLTHQKRQACLSDIEEQLLQNKQNARKGGDTVRQDQYRHIRRELRAAKRRC